MVRRPLRGLAATVMATDFTAKTPRSPRTV